MFKHRVLLYAGVLALLSSCRLDLSVRFFPKVDEAGNFWAYNFAQRSYYRVDAELLVDDPLVAVYADRSVSLAPFSAEGIAAEYVTRIRDSVIEVFGDFAPYTRSAKLTLLFLDIQDGWKSGSYTAGYFSYGDLYPQTNNNPYSNTANVLYLDTNPALTVQKGADTYTTIAHELQHLINFAYRNRPILGGAVDNAVRQEVWIDEGLSLMAEDLYRGRIDQGRINYFNNAGNSRIAQGDNFFVWDQGSYDEYVTAYLFFQWLRVHSAAANPIDAARLKDYGIFKDIAQSSFADYQAVTGAVAAHIPGLPLKDLSPDRSLAELFRTWHLANLGDLGDKPSVEVSSFYGYGDEIRVIPPLYTGLSPTLLLKPGEAVYSKSSMDPSLSSDQEGGSGGSDAPHIHYYETGTMRLTFNTNTNNKSYILEPGYVAPSVPPALVPQSSGGLHVIPAGEAQPVDARPPLR
jgi:hypothetical protein